jgi:hypothetical protein
VELFGLLCFGICFSVVVHHLATILRNVFGNNISVSTIYLKFKYEPMLLSEKLPDLCEFVQISILAECSMIIVAIALLSLSLSLVFDLSPKFD